MKIILTGGGTAGHVIPLIPLIQELDKRGHQILYIGAGEPEQNLVKGVKFIKIAAGKWRRYWDWRNFLDPFKFLIGLFQAVGIVARHNPAFVFAKGGYVSLPVVLAAWLQGIPVYIHESDLAMGFANKLASALSQKVFTGFPVENYGSSEKLFYSGVPVRPEFGKPATRKDRELFGLQDDWPGVLATGGSQGAQGINRLVFSSLNDLVKRFQVVHLTGEVDIKKAIVARDHLPVNLRHRYKVFRYLGNDMAAAMRATDMVVCRGGATTLAEVLAAGKRAAVVPLPSSAGDHQRRNGKFYLENFGFRVLEKGSATTAKLMEAIEEILADKSPLPTVPNSIQKILSELPLKAKE